MADRCKAVVDLFAGCGGLSLGAHYAGFESVLAVDIDQQLSSSFTKNFNDTAVRHWDLSKTTKADFTSILGDRRISGLIGGPPCQGFSTIGKRAIDDPRNGLIGHFFRHVSMLAPKFFILENVPGILKGSAREYLEDGMDSIASEYRIVGPFTVNAADFGAATSRSRVMVIGYDSNDVNPLEEKDFDCDPAVEPATVGATIGDLASPGDGTTDETGYDWQPYRYYSSPSVHASRYREVPRSNLGWKVAIDYLRIVDLTTFPFRGVDS
jgi:DNA (cytosine-5)-methyltransferase 1